MLYFKNEPIGDMVAVGAVQPTSVRLWIRSKVPGRLRVRWRARERNDGGELTVEVKAGNAHDHIVSVSVPGNDSRRLTPLARYRYEVRDLAEGRLIGEGSFETAPASLSDSPTRLTIGLMSCNQPFDQGGNIHPSSAAMVDATYKCVRDHDVKMTFMVGDQMYSDKPNSLSLFNDAHFQQVAPPGRSTILSCTAEEVRALYHDRYRHFWNLPGLRAIQSEIPTYPILDDHDLIDNWGSDARHEEAAWQAIGRGGRLAYLDYQASRVQDLQEDLPVSFHYAVEYGFTATFVMDLRSARRVGDDAQLYSPQQETDFVRFLKEHADKAVIFIVVSVPPVHLPRFLAKLAARLTDPGEDFSDRWSSAGHLRDRDRFLKIIYEHQQKHPRQKIVLLSGDIHIACAHHIQWRGKGRSELYQFISSPLSHQTTPGIRMGSRTIIRLNRALRTSNKQLRAKVRLVKGVEEMKCNPYDGLNIGLIECEKTEEGANIRYLIYGHEGDRPRCFYASPWL